MQRNELVSYDLPDCPGVYLFTLGKGRAKKILYIGKATSLRDRVRSYFDVELMATRGPRIVDMVTRADGLLHEPTTTVLEALVREAALIREHHPPANAIGKDDKSFLYTVITKEPIPRVLAIRGKDIDFDAKQLLDQPDVTYRAAHGPFTSGPQLREALKLIRRIFPFYDTPTPVPATGLRSGRPNTHANARLEFNRQIGLFPKDMDHTGYLQSVCNVSMYLSGRVKTLKETLARDMRKAASEERFEDAAVIRRQLFSLDHVQDVSLIQEEKNTEANSIRIEAYDTAHISGTNAIGVMVVIDHGIPNKKEYRTFTIRGIGDKSLNNDIASLKELLSRRMGHAEWPMPRVIVVDGGKTHKKAAETALQEMGIGIPVVAVVKDEKHRPREVIGGMRAGVSDADAVLANTEAHRFSLSKHRAARTRQMRTSLDAK